MDSLNITNDNAPRSPDQLSRNKKYDYVIIGGGTAGCVVASRLSKDNRTSVLVLERGKEEEDNPALKIPTVNTVLLPVAYETIPSEAEHSRESTYTQSPFYTDTFNLIVPYALGGGPTVSGSFWGRGDPGNFAEWVQLGATGWSYNDVLPLYKKLENHKRPFHSGIMHPSRGTSGPVSTLTLDGTDARLQPLIQKASQVWGLPIITDANTPSGQLGISPMERSLDVSKGVNKPKRSTSYNTYIKPNLNRRNLTVYDKSTVTRIVWAKKQGKTSAKYVEFMKNGTFQRVEVGKELIISAGALNTPHTLLHSGIGPRQHLRDMGVDVVVDLPGVGRNLMDHLVFNYVIALNPAAFPNLTEPLAPMIHFSKSTPNGPIDMETAWGILPALPGGVPLLVMYVVGLRNSHRGHVQMNSSDPLSRPSLTFNFASNDEDFNKMIREFRLIKTWFAELQAAGIALAEVSFPHLTATSSDAEWLAALKPVAAGWWHPAGTCKMGANNDPMAVVDPKLRLRGVTNVRIADNSIHPVIVTTHPSATAMMIGERCYDFIKGK